MKIDGVGPIDNRPSTNYLHVLHVSLLASVVFLVHVCQQVKKVNALQVGLIAGDCLEPLCKLVCLQVTD